MPATPTMPPLPHGYSIERRRHDSSDIVEYIVYHEDECWPASQGGGLRPAHTVTLDLGAPELDAPPVINHPSTGNDQSVDRALAECSALAMAIDEAQRYILATAKLS